MIAIISYQVATYSGTIPVNYSEDELDEQIIARAKRILTRQAGGYLPFGVQVFKIISKS